MGAPRLAAVNAWLSTLRDTDPSPAAAPLSPAGARFAWQTALSALDRDALARATAIPGEPFGRAVYVAARTVFTAPLEWAAVLLARGTSFVLKAPSDNQGWSALYAETAQRSGLPLTVSSAREALHGAELLIAMGSDASIAEIDASAQAERKLLFGARFSIAWVTDLGSVDALARDAALYDGRGCMSPVAVVSPLPSARVAERLARAMADAEQRWPRGGVSPTEAASIRTRRALARACGAVHEGPGWAVLELPEERFSPAGLPRVLAVHTVADRPAFERLLAPWLSRLSTIGTDDPALAVHGPRLVRPGTMQAPPVERVHDGVDWLRAIVRGSG